LSGAEKPGRKRSFCCPGPASETAVSAVLRRRILKGFHHPAQRLAAWAAYPGGGTVQIPKPCKGFIGSNGFERIEKNGAVPRGRARTGCGRMPSQNTILRYGRLQVCVTTNPLQPCSADWEANASVPGAALPKTRERGFLDVSAHNPLFLQWTPSHAPLLHRPVMSMQYCHLLWFAPFTIAVTHGMPFRPAAVAALIPTLTSETCSPACRR